METLHTLLSQQTIERLGWTLIHFVWQATAVALLLAVALRLLRRRSANIRYLVSCLALALVVALPLVTMPLIDVSGPVAEAGPILNPPPTDAIAVELLELGRLPFESLDTPPLELPERAIRIPWTQRIAIALEPALPWLVLGWLLGVFGLSAWHLGGWAQLQRMKRRMVRDVAEPLHAALAHLSNRLGVRRTVGLLESALVEVPTVVGWLKPVILLPASALSGLTPEQLEAILAHELAHVRRCDYLANLAQTVIEILGFYHPAVWWVSHQIRDERENCCDDLAVQVCGDSLQYARALTCLEELRHVVRASRPGARKERARARCPRHTAVAASGGSLVARIARLLGRPPIDHRRFAWLPGLVALLVLAAILIPAALLIAAPNMPPVMNTGTDLAEDAGDDNVEKTRLVHRNVEGQIDREFSFERLIREEGDHWIVAEPYLKQSVGEICCHVTADRGELRFDGALNQPTPDGGTFRGNVVIEITSSEPNSIDAYMLYLDEVTFSAQNKRFISSGSVRLVSGSTELAGRGLELSFDEPQDRFDPSRLTIIDGVRVRITPWGSLIVSPGEPKTEVSEASGSTQQTRVHLLTETTGSDAPSPDEKRRITVDFALFNIPTDRPLTPEAAARLSSLWDQSYAKRAAGREERAWLPNTEELQISPQKLLERCPKDGQGDSEAIKIMVDLLVSLEYAHVVMNPRVEVFDGQQAQVMSKQHVPDPTAHPGAPETVECRNLVTVTPRVDSAGHIYLDLAAEICDVILNDGKTPRISKHSIDTKAVVDKNRTFVCRLESAAEGETQDNGVLYLLAHPRVVRSAPSASAAIQTAESEPSGLGTVTAMFEGTDKRQALETVAEMARVSIVYDPNLTGEVYATLDDVSIEAALLVILAGSPYVATRTPDGYAITTRNVQPPTAPSQEIDAVAIETRFVLVDPECLEALRRGLPIEGVTAPADVNALHEIGAVIAEGRTPLLESDRVALLLKAIRQYAGTKILATPKVTVLDGESASMSLSDNIEYVSGYRESNDGSPEPIPQHASKEVGVRFDATPQIIEDQNDIRLRFEMEITSLLARQKALYQGKHEYDVPTFTTATVETEIVIPDGQTALIHAGPIRSFGDILRNENDPPAPMLMLIKPTRTTVQPPDPTPPIPDNPGLGALPPATNRR